MSEFDPYHRWLSIPPEEQPPHQYRLLGVRLFESDPDVIESAADRQMAHVRSFQGGKHADQSQHLLNEISAARAVLLNPEKKQQLDARLRAAYERVEQARSIETPQAAPVVVNAGQVRPTTRPVATPTLPLILVGILAGVLLTLGVVGYGVLNPAGETAAETAQGDKSRQPPKPRVGGVPDDSALAELPLLNDGIRDAWWASARPIDLMALVKLPRDQVRGAWTLKESALYSPEEAYARVRFPLIPPDEYDLRLQVEPLGGEGDSLVVVLSGRGGSRFFVQFEGYNNYEHSGLEMIDGKKADQNETHVRGEVLRRNQTNEVLIVVRAGAIRVSVDGREIINWSGDLGRLSADTFWEDPGESAVVVGSYRSRVAIRSAVLTPFSPRSPPARYPPIGGGHHAWHHPAPAGVPANLAKFRKVFLDDLPESSFSTGWGTLGKHGLAGFPLDKTKKPLGVLFKGVRPAHSLCAHPPTDGYSQVTYRLNGAYQRFSSRIGIAQDPRGKNPTVEGTVTFRVHGDGRLLSEQAVSRRRGLMESIRADIRGVKTLTLIVDCKGKSRHVWAAWLAPTIEK